MDRVIALSVSQLVSQSVSGHLNEHFEWIRNTCSFFLQDISNEWKNNFTNKNHMMSCEKQGFLLSPNSQTKPHSDFNISYYCYGSTFIPNKAQSASSASASNAVHGVSTVLGTSCFNLKISLKYSVSIGILGVLKFLPDVWCVVQRTVPRV